MKKEIIKPFDLEAYNKGAKIKTRDGHEVRIICTDAKHIYYPIITLVKLKNDNESIMNYTLKGKVYYTSNNDDAYDLVIVEEVEEPEFCSDKENKVADGYFISFGSYIIYNFLTQYNQKTYRYFATKKQAKSARAMARISQIMANDVEHFGGVVTDEEWEDNYEYKFVIYRLHNNISVKCVRSNYQFLAFHTEAQRGLFLEKYRDLVKDYLMID